MKRCGICRKNYRGAGRRVVTADGNKNACPACVARAFLVVPVDSFAPCVSCGKAASLCEVCARGRNISDRATAMEDAALVLLGRVKPIQIRIRNDGDNASAHDVGYVDGVEMAISMLRTGRF